MNYCTKCQQEFVVLEANLEDARTIFFALQCGCGDWEGGLSLTPFKETEAADGSGEDK